MWAKRIDKNHTEIVQELRLRGYAVLDLHEVGKGCPDLLISTARDMWLVEIKSEKGQLNEKEIGWMLKWKGKPVIVARSAAEVITKIGLRSSR